MEKKEIREKDERQIETVIFIPYTPGGVLRKRMQEEDDKLMHTSLFCNCDC